MKHIKQISLLAVALLMIVAQLIIPASAESTVLTNLMPSNDKTKGKLTLTGCTMEENSDGSVTFTLTATTANVKMVFAENVYQEESGGTIYSGEAFDVTKGAFVVYDYASADGVTFSKFVAHYTRKDKAADNKLADLFLNSMESDSTYAKHRKVSGTGYGVWDLGTYITVDKGSSCLFDNHMHRFCDLDFDMTGKVGAKLTIYKLYVSSTADVKDLGKVRPEPTKFESSAASSETSSQTPSADTSSTASKETSSAAKSESVSSTSSATKSDTSSKSASSAASSVTTDSTDSEDSSNWWIYVVIGVVVVAVVGVVVYFVSKNKNKQ